MKYPKLNILKLTLKEFWLKFESWALCAVFEAGGEAKFLRLSEKEKNLESAIERFKAKGVLK
jgi:hypothetical protein